uniref:Stereocilin LRR domain-containing protein n=1 Tax=Nothobranchius furzeri TaxID=105023 RepID=A0A8C6KDV6_NOTFU
MRNILGGIKTLFPNKNLPSLNKPIDRHRLSGFLYNISLYLQEMGAELEEVPAEGDEEQLWGKLLEFFLQSEGSAAPNQWNGHAPPRPSIKVQDWFLSLRGSPHWDWLLGLLQSLITLSERQPQKPILAFLSENWRTVSAVLEATLQALISGTYGQASAGLQGFICALKGRNDCTFSVSWLQQVLQFLETRSWKPVVSLHPAGEAAGPSKSPFGLLLQALSPLVQSLDGLRRGLLHRVGSSVYGNLRKKVSQVTMALLDDVSSLVDAPQANSGGQCSVGEGVRHNVMWNTQALGSQGLPGSLPFLSCPSNQRETLQSQKPSTYSKTAPSSQKPFRQNQIQILEAACNESIPGLTGVSNFTVFLYCKLFEGENGPADPAMGHMGLDLHETCSDAAWYLSAAEDDFFWVHVCSEFFAQEFNNTVCANSSFWLQRAQQVNQTFLISKRTNSLCVQLSDEEPVSPGLSETCLSQLGSRSLNAEAFRNCFLPNNSVLVSALCDSQQPLPEGSWAAAYCSKMHNLSLGDPSTDTCQYTKWSVQHFTNSTLLKLCGRAQGLREHVCLNATLYHQLVKLKPRLADVCADLQAEQESKKCFLQRFFDMLPARYEFDTSQLCVEPAPLLVDLLHKLSVCEMEGGEREGFLVAMGYLLRVLDFVVGLSSGLDEGEREARQGLGQAILLSSLIDNASWTMLQPEASTSVLHTVGVFLRKEQNATLKEDLLSCFSVRSRCKVTQTLFLYSNTNMEYCK